MELEEFSIKIKEFCEKINIDITSEEVCKFFEYMNLLLECNKNVNLTAITEPNDVVLKHFVDSLTINKYIKENKKVIDIGTGAGFPGVPLGIYRKDTSILLMDSLNKRIKFLEDVCEKIELSNVKTIHARAEELAKQGEYREQFDYATSRAVASLNVLLEYMLPFVKIGGYCICMKGSNVLNEIENAQKALDILGGTIEKIDKFCLPESDIIRNVILIKKIRNTPNKYPRKAGAPSREPIQ